MASGNKDESLGMEQRGSQVVHVRGDSDSELQALFEVVLKPTSSSVPLQKPFKMRNLPASFFTPPAHRQSPAPTITHSRESSADSTYGGGGGGLRAPGGMSPGAAPQHFRHHSSPASLQQTFAVAQQQQQQHIKQLSYDLGDDPNSLPPGWEQARTPQGQIYYLNHITQSTTWEDPRKTLQKQRLRQQQQQQQQQQQPGPHVAVSAGGGSGVGGGSGGSGVAPPPPPPPAPGPPQGPSPQPSLVNGNLGPLPDSWEQAVTTEGEVYFINHDDKSTSWFDPRLPRRLQTPAILNGAVQPPQHSPASPSQQQQQAAQQTQASGQPPPPPPAPQVSHQLPPLAPSSTSSAALQARQQSLRLQRLQVEHERLRLRQQEIIKSEQSLRMSLRDEAGQQQVQPQTQQQSSTQQTAQPQHQQQGSELMVTPGGLTLPSAPQTVTPVTSAGDPFITTPDLHSRQESADSGLGLGTNYSLPHTPEDFLASMEDVEITPSDAEMKTSPANNILEAPELEESMDSEDLVPTIQLNDDLSSDFLDDMLETTKMDNLHTWL